jgi:hypothetical protein
MMVTATMPVRFHLVVPLAHEATAMRIKETAARVRGRSCAVSPLIGDIAFAGVTWIARTNAVRA